MSKKIIIKKRNSQLQAKLAQALGAPKAFAQLLINRGIKSADEAKKFLQPQLTNLLSPWQLDDMDLAVKRIRQAKQKNEKVLIFGDYDVDGITAVALLKTHFEKLGLSVMHYIPHRVTEGYGLNPTLIKIAKKNNVKLIVTVDCGITSSSIIRKLNEAAIDVIITDHHEQGGELPPAVAILNPKRRDSSYGFRELSGVGVAYKLAQALTDSTLRQDLDLVALGTVADRVVLNGENRIIAKEGLTTLGNSSRVGIEALIKHSGVKRDKPLTTTTIGFILGPRINASGRIDSAETALKLLLSTSGEEAQELARLLNTHNRKRQQIEGGVLKEVHDLIDKEINFKKHSVIVVSGQDWHQGVLGIVASRIMDKFYRPVVIISEGEQVHCRGSARSIKGFSMFDALSHCKEHLDDFGGHKYAAGLVITKDNIQNFKRDINHFARRVLTKENLLPSIEVDMEVGLSDIDEDLVSRLESLEPFGSGNPEPLFYVRNLSLRSQPQKLARETLKFWVTDSERTYQVIAFGFASLKNKLVSSGSLDLVFYPRIDNWQGRRSLILEAKELIPTT